LISAQVAYAPRTLQLAAAYMHMQSTIDKEVRSIRFSDLRNKVAAWLAERRQLRTNFTRSLTVSPSVAFDALLFVNTLTPARATPQ
jgi:erythromycin esterase-like protein